MTGSRIGWAVAIGAMVIVYGAEAQRLRLGEPTSFAVAMHAPQGYLGVDLREVADGGLAPGHGVRGAEILRVDHDGPACKAGLIEHDIVLMMNGQPIDGAEPMRRMLHEIAPGRPVALTISRAGQQKTVSMLMGNREDVDRVALEQLEDPYTPPSPSVEPQAVRRGNSFLGAPGRVSRSLLGGIVLSPAYTGAMLETMEPQLAEFFGAQGKTGLLVRSVDANSPAATAGLRAGDVVVRVNAVSIATSSDWVRVVRDNKGKAIPVVVLRERREQILTIVPNAKHHSLLLPDFWPHRASAFWSGNTPDRASVSPRDLPR